MIEETVSKIKGGVQLVDRTSEKFTGVSESTAKVATLMSEIDVASTEQSNGVEQVSTTMQEMSSVTQTIAANAEESAGVAEEMDGQTRSMLQATEALSILAGLDVKLQNESRNQETGRTYERGQTNEPSRRTVPQLPPARSTSRPPASQTKTSQSPSEVIPFGDDDEGDFEDF